MSYMLLIVEPPDQRIERGEQAGREVYDQMVQFAADLKERGKLLAVESLASEAVRVQVRGGQPKLLDGPFAEAKEVVGGYAMLDAQSLEEAIALTERFVELHVADGWELDCEVRQVYEADFS